MIFYGKIHITTEFVFCGHPGLSCDIYRFSVTNSGLYSIYVDEQPNSLNKANAVSIQMMIDPNVPLAMETKLKYGMSNDCHGGVMICDISMFNRLGQDFENEGDSKIWNYFSNGICMKGSSEYGLWKSNSPNGNVIFVPSDEYYTLYECNNG